LPARWPLSPFAYVAITPHDAGLGGWPRVSSSRARAQAQVHLSRALTRDGTAAEESARVISRSAWDSLAAA
jgi:hypothetical protein